MLEIVWQFLICFEIGVLAKYKQSILPDLLFIYQEQVAYFKCPEGIIIISSVCLLSGKWAEK